MVDFKGKYLIWVCTRLEWWCVGIPLTFVISQNASWVAVIFAGLCEVVFIECGLEIRYSFLRCSRKLHCCVSFSKAYTLAWVYILWFNKGWAWVKVWPASSILPFTPWLNPIRRTFVLIVLFSQSCGMMAIILLLSRKSEERVLLRVSPWTFFPPAWYNIVSSGNLCHHWFLTAVCMGCGLWVFIFCAVTSDRCVRVALS